MRDFPLALEEDTSRARSYFMELMHETSSRAIQ